MDTRQLAAFCEVVERRSFSEAASRLGVTQPAVSQQVRALEQRLGTQLLDRSGRRVEPTEAGLRLYRGAQRMLALEEQLLDELAEPDAPLHGTLELGASTGPAAIVLPVLLCEFQRQNTELRVELSVSDTQSVVELVADRRLELGIVGAARRHRSVAFEPFFRDEVILACPPGHPFAGHAVGLDQLGEGPLILMQRGAGVRQMVEDELRKNGKRLRDLEVPLELGLQESVRSAVLGGFGVGFISRQAVATELAAGTLVEARVRGLDLARDIYIARASGRAGLECSAGVRRLRAGAASGVIVRWGLEELPAPSRTSARSGRCSSPRSAGTCWRSRRPRAGARSRPTASPFRQGWTGSSPSAVAARSTPPRPRRPRRRSRSFPSRPPTPAPSGRRSSACGRPTAARSAAAPAPVLPRSCTSRS